MTQPSGKSQQNLSQKDLTLKVNTLLHLTVKREIYTLFAHFWVEREVA